MRPYTTVRCETAIHSTWSCNSRWSCIIWQCSESDAKKEESRVETRLSKQVQYWRSVNHALFGLSFMRMFFLKKKNSLSSSFFHPPPCQLGVCPLHCGCLSPAGGAVLCAAAWQCAWRHLSVGPDSQQCLQFKQQLQPGSFLPDLGISWISFSSAVGWVLHGLKDMYSIW